MNITILYPSESQRPNRVTMPVPPFNIEACKRDESAPYQRITMLKRTPKREKPCVYEAVKSAIIEFREEGDWLV